MRTKACLGSRCGVGAVGETSLKDMKVLIGQRSLCRRGTPVEWSSIFAFWWPLWKCKSKDRKRVREMTKCRAAFNFHRGPLENLSLFVQSDQEILTKCPGRMSHLRCFCFGENKQFLWDKCRHYGNSVEIIPVKQHSQRSFLYASINLANTSPSRCLLIFCTEVDSSSFLSLERESLVFFQLFVSTTCTVVLVCCLICEMRAVPTLLMGWPWSFSEERCQTCWPIPICVPKEATGPVLRCYGAHPNLEPEGLTQ